MTANATLRQLVGLPDSPAPLSESTLIMIDCQNTYTWGVMELEGVQAALDQAEELLSNARDAAVAPVCCCPNESARGSTDERMMGPGELGAAWKRSVSTATARGARPGTCRPAATS